MNEKYQNIGTITNSTDRNIFIRSTAVIKRRFTSKVQVKSKYHQDVLSFYKGVQKYRLVEYHSFILHDFPQSESKENFYRCDDIWNSFLPSPHWLRMQKLIIYEEPRIGNGSLWSMVKVTLLRVNSNIHTEGTKTTFQPFYFQKQFIKKFEVKTNCII